MCGVSAILLGDSKADTAAADLHESLFYLQHRGQDAAGIAVCKGGRVSQCKGLGMASKVFDEGRRVSTAALPGFMGISHVRYPTAGTTSAAEAQPFFVNSPYGLSMSVNGNLVNTPDLITFLDYEARRHVNTDSDSELLLNIFAHALGELGKARANVDDVFSALREVYARCIGAFACTAMLAGFGILGFRDQNGIRPLCLGSRPSETLEGATDYFLASESIALVQLGFKNIVDILPGQAVFIKKGEAPRFAQIVAPKSYTPDLFEYLYLARADSCIDGISVHRSRQNMGLKLANRMRQVLSEEAIKDIDVVIPIPETSNTAAATLAEALSKPFSNGFVKNRYVYRTFILPGQKARQKSVRRKLSPIASEFKGKVVCLVDDSIVRGTTSREIVQMVKECEAKRIVLVSCSPEITHPHVHGIDLADPAQLLAHGRSLQDMTDLIKCDALVFQTLDDLKAACMDAIDGSSQVTDFEVGVFCGNYKTPVPDNYFERLNIIHSAGKKPAAGSVTTNGDGAFLVASSGPVNGVRHAENDEGSEYREDISLYNNNSGRS
ncbi:amidophosphoribosyltransferase [Sporothrix schenckii 1099-18]|uniref:Amidophosphoribosyltransferase n=2 Tax=Sporothrix schenckii TaxID=29908 RepID=U7PWH9_SPOS1|nr:amidophosphoribosyltransferase [Sporothrix schenckii 1099-18]ERS99922.1 amidophosphoribosyltransferase [Sporothrix schenckii ATCC 58251]KJR85678.1 amidophosphoribosyltransferase [Sporothrix schenckii 1099-18]